MRAGALAFALLMGCTGGLSGEIAGAPVDDWSFVSEADDVAFETAGGETFGPLAQARSIVVEGDLHLQVTSIFEGGNTAVDAVLDGEGVRMRANGTVYLLTATPLTTPEKVAPLLPTLLRRSGVEATGARFDPTPERYPGTQIQQWFFRLESATP